MEKDTGKWQILASLIGAIALIISALIGGWFSLSKEQMTINATQTAESRIQVLSTPNQQIMVITPIPQATQTSSSQENSTGLVFNSYGFFLITSLSFILGLFFIISRMLMNFNKYLSESIDSFKKASAFGNAAYITIAFLLLWGEFFLGFPNDLGLWLVLFMAIAGFALVVFIGALFIGASSPNENVDGKLILLLVVWGIITLITAFTFTTWQPIKSLLVSVAILGVLFGSFWGLNGIAQKLYNKEREKQEKERKEREEREKARLRTPAYPPYPRPEPKYHPISMQNQSKESGESGDVYKNLPKKK